MILQDLTKIQQDLAMILPKILRDLAMILQDLTEIQQDLAMTLQDLTKYPARSCHDPPISYQNRGKNTWQIQNEEALHEIYYSLDITLIEFIKLT
jgi:hypothetical protein